MTLPYRRQLVIVNTDNKCVVHTRLDVATASAARITKDLYATLTDGKHIAYYAHQPTKIRVPAAINGRFYVKPAGWTPKA
jgi:hypothetical protein